MNKSDELDLKSTIFYYFREKQYNSMLNKSKEGISKFKGDASFHLFHCLSLILANRLEEGIHSLETINMENEIKLAVTIALMYSHKLFGVSNKNLFLKLDGQMRDYRKDADAGDFYYSAFVLLCFNKSEKALDYAEKALAMQSSLSECLSLKGWILLYLYERGKRAAMNIKDVFEHALQLNPKNLDIIMGFTESCLLQNDSSKALEIINKAIVHHSATNLPLLQKLKIQLAAFEWDQVQETVNRINTIDSKNLYVKKISIIIKLCRLTNYEEAALDIENLSHLLDTVEPGNIQIVCEYSQLFSGICNKNVEILSQTTAMLVNALQNNPESLELIIELGYQALARGNSKEAAR
ncbi:hypothetical protein NQ315_003556 [Exocentrus adspersus]|uniref:Uncharacterized protein n=1 Tax=Exocentrus adspersus TaxID=1586481 RepID=A0AAV8VD37_9CUCU|nr:hypothetical protein NQ315_003556 [Exocentrus adspersus]